MKNLFLVLIGFGLTLPAMAQHISWGSEVVAYSSEFVYEKRPGQYLALQALGKPNVLPSFGQSPAAWVPSQKQNPEGEYIEVAFADITPIQQVLVNENFNAGAISEISLRSTDGQLHTVYTNEAPKLIQNGRLLRVTFERTPYAVQSVKINLRTAAVDGFNQIDAVGVADHTQQYELTINTPEQAMDIGKPINLGAAINTKADEMLPIISPDGKTLYFTRDKNPENIGPDTQDIWYSSIDDEGNFADAKNMGKPLNSEGNSSLLSITPDGQTALLLNTYLPDGSTKKGVSMTKRTATGWGFPYALTVEDFYNDNKFGEYCLGSSGEVMIMTLQRKESLGSKDLFVSFKQEDGQWSRPESLGTAVNTAASESSPFLAADERTLYFSTSGWPGYGNNDLFVSRRLGEGWQQWSEPVNLGANINTPEYDAYFSLPASGDYVYYMSYANKSGGADIYRCELDKALRPQPVVLVKGKVSNRKTGEPIATDVQYASLAGGKTAGSAFSDPETGQYSVVMTAGNLYGFSASKKGFLPVSENLDLRELKDYQEVERDLLLVPIEQDATIILNNLYFDTGKADIREESFVELRQLVKVLQENPNVKVEIAGHTDDIGSHESNQTLSQNRAQSVVAFLEEAGIGQGRLISKGYGETQPAYENNSDENRQKNRRVAFKILAVE